MKNLLTNISSVYWWISVVVVGIVINLASAYLKTKLDTNLSNASSWWRKRSEAHKARRAKDLKRLTDNPHDQMLLAFGEMRDRIRAVSQFIIASLCFVVVALLTVTAPPGFDRSRLVVFKIIFMALGSLGFISGLSVFRRAINKMILLMDARELDKSVSTDTDAQQIVGPERGERVSQLD